MRWTWFPFRLGRCAIRRFELMLRNAALTHDTRVCFLYPAGTGYLRGGSGGWHLHDGRVVPCASHTGAVGGGLGSWFGGCSYLIGGGSPVRDLSLSYQVSHPGSESEPSPSQISPLLRLEDVARPTSGLAPMDQYLPWSASLSLGESTDSPSLPAPLTPRRIIEELVAGVSCWFPDRGAACCCGPTEYAGLVSGGPL